MGLDKYFRRSFAERSQPTPFNESWRKKLRRKPNSTKKGKFKLQGNRQGYHSNTIVKYIDGKFITHFRKIPAIGAIKTCLLIQESNDSGIKPQDIHDIIEEQKILSEEKKFKKANKLFEKLQELQEKYNEGRIFDSVRGNFRVLKNTKVNGYVLTEVEPV